MSGMWEQADLQVYLMKVTSLSALGLSESSCLTYFWYNSQHTPKSAMKWTQNNSDRKRCGCDTSPPAFCSHVSRLKKGKNILRRLPGDPLCHVVFVLGSTISAPATEPSHCIKHTEMGRLHLIFASQIHSEWVWYMDAYMHVCAFLYKYVSKSLTKQLDVHFYLKMLQIYLFKDIHTSPFIVSFLSQLFHYAKRM